MDKKIKLKRYITILFLAVLFLGISLFAYSRISLIGKKATLVFVDDDSRIESYKNWLRLSKEENINITFAVIPEWINHGYSTTTTPKGEEVMSIEQLKEIYDNGNDVVSHGWSSTTLNDLLSNKEKIDSELKNSKQWLIDNGFTRNDGDDIFVYPQGLKGTSEEQKIIQNKVSEYYEYGVNAFTEDKHFTLSNMDNLNIPRATGDRSDSWKLKLQLDECIRDEGVMVVLTHAWHINDIDNGSYDKWSERYRELIDYAKEQDVEITTLSNALKN